MLFCKECGAEVKADSAFCNTCGTATQPVNEKKEVPPQQHVPPQKMTKKTKMLLIGLGAAAVLLFGAYKIGENITDKDRLIEKFEIALIDGDTAEIANLLHSNDPQLKITNKNVKGFVSYYKKHPDEVSDLIESLKVQSDVMTKESDSAQKAASELFGDEMISNNVVNLKKDGKTALLYDKFTLDVKPVFITITTNYKDTQMTLDGKKLDKADKQNFEKTYGPYLPGIYNVEATLKTDFVDLKKKEEVSLINNGDEVEVDLYLDGEDVTVNMDTFNTKTKTSLFINGKDVKINPLENPTFGPLLTDGSMNLQVQAEVPWGKMKTDEIPIADSEVNVNLGKSTDLQTVIFNQVVTYTKGNLEAFTSGDSEKSINVTEAYNEEIKEGIEYAKNDQEYYKGQYLASVFAIDSLNVYYSDGQWMAEVEVLQSYKEDHYYEGDIPELEESDVNKIFYLLYDEKQKKWLVNEVESSYGYGTDHVKEIKEKDPKTYQTTWSKSVSSEVDTEEISAFVEDYMYASVEAINEADFSLVEAFLDPSGKKYKEQKDYTAYLNEKNIKEELLGIEIKEVKELDNSMYQVTSYDQYKLLYDDGTEKLSNFTTVQNVKIMPDGSYAMYELVSTEEK